MKRINTYQKTTQKLLVLVILFTSTVLIGQDECPEPLGSTILEVNNVRALITNRQMAWYDGIDNLYEVPAGSGVNSFFAANFWIAGLSPDGQLKIAAGTFEQDGSRFGPGPLAEYTAELDPGICEAYNRLFVVTREMSETHVQYFEAVEAGTVAEEFPNGYDIPQVLLDYPGTITTSWGVSPQGAPYWDYDENGVYSPLGGDFPLFSNMEDEGACEACETLSGDVSIYWIDNDNTPGNIGEDQEAIGIEIHNQVYAYETGGDIGNTIFHQKKIINKGVQTLHNTYVGLWADPDLGCYEDDYVGCDVERNLGIVYNGDNNDQDCGVSGYGEDPPAAGILVLQGPYKDPDGGPVQTHDMDGFMAFSGNSSFPQTDPVNAAEYYNALRSRWQDGTPMTHGGDGFGGEIETKFAYPHDTDPTFIGTDGVVVDPWSEISAANSLSDRRFVMSYGPFTLDPGEVNCMSYATIFAPSDGSENPIAAIQDVADNVKESYDNCFQNLISGIDIETIEDFAFLQWDNNSLELNVQSLHNQENQISIFDAQGKMLLQDSFQGESVFSLQDFSSGVYIVKLVSKKGEIQTERFVLGK